MKDNNFFQSLFHQQRVQLEAPSFEDIYGKAQQKHRTMQFRKWTLVAVLLTAFVLGGIALTSKDAGKEVPTLQASITLYETLMKEGKFVTTDIYFEFGKAVIKEESKPVLEDVFDVLSDHPNLQLSIEGHTDHQGSERYNYQLSTLRAAAIKQFLLKKGIADDRLSSQGFGEAKPAHSNESEEGRHKNRRVEFVVR